MNPVFLVGCGYVGRQLAQRLQVNGHKVMALVRTDSSYELLRAQGLQAVRIDLDDPTEHVILQMQGALIYYFAPPPPAGIIDTRMMHFLNAITESPCPARIVLISTSGVYGDCQGEWVTEDRPPQPATDRARRRLDAERQALAWGEAHDVPVIILRVPGIYGPGRLPEKRLRSREPVLREQESPWSNRVHVHDLVRACLAAGETGRPSAVYNISDGHPTTMTDYFNRVADALGLERPPQITLVRARIELSEAMQSYLDESKRLDNRRMRKELGVEPRYPDLIQGLAACLADDRPQSVG